MTVTSDEDDDKVLAPYWFAIFELAYIVIFVVISVVVHLLRLLQMDDDAVTIHHRIHKDVIAQQERNFIAQRKENFLHRNPL